MTPSQMLLNISQTEEIQFPVGSRTTPIVAYLAEHASRNKSDIFSNGPFVVKLM